VQRVPAAVPGSSLAATGVDSSAGSTAPGRRGQTTGRGGPDGQKPGHRAVEAGCASLPNVKPVAAPRPPVSRSAPRPPTGDPPRRPSGRRLAHVERAGARLRVATTRFLVRRFATARRGAAAIARQFDAAEESGGTRAPDRASGRFVRRRRRRASSGLGR